MKIFQNILLIALLGLMTVACQKHDANPYDPQSRSPYSSPIVTINTPLDVLLKTGETLVIDVDFQSEATIDHVEVKLVNLTDGSTEVYRFDQLVKEEDGSYSHEHLLSVEVEEESDFRLEASTWKEGESEKVSQSIDFKVLP